MALYQIHHAEQILTAAENDNDLRPVDIAVISVLKHLDIRISLAHQTSRDISNAITRLGSRVAKLESTSEATMLQECRERYMEWSGGVEPPVRDDPEDESPFVISWRAFKAGWIHSREPSS